MFLHGDALRQKGKSDALAIGGALANFHLG
jgi:hypothetical protein